MTIRIQEHTGHKVNPESNWDEDCAHPGLVSQPVLPFQSLKLLKSSPKVCVAVPDRLFGSIAIRGFPPISESSIDDMIAVA